MNGTILTEVVPGSEWRALAALPEAPRPRALLNRCVTIEALEGQIPSALPPLCGTPCGEPHHPTTMHKAVNDLYTTLKERQVRDERLVVATLVLHRANFGLVVYKHPRPGIIHAYNKKFGDAPLFVPEGPEIGILTSVRDYFYRS